MRIEARSPVKRLFVKMEAGKDEDQNLVYGKMDGEEESYLRSS